VTPLSLSTWCITWELVMEGSVGHTSNPEPHSKRGYYDTNYGSFQEELYSRIRRDAFGDDIGQSSWLTAEEQDSFLPLLKLCPGKKLLDVACGAGGPVLRIATKTGCSVLGIDVHPDAISAASSLAAERRMAEVSEFYVEDATRSLSFPDSSFDAITCIDSINHLPDRRSVVSEWVRVLKPAGRLLFTDPTVVTGPLTNEEIAIRTYAGFYLLTTPAYNEEVLRQCGLRKLAIEDVTQTMAESARRRKAARATYEPELRATEGDRAYEAQQNFLAMVAKLAQERRLSRFVFAAEKPGELRKQECAAIFANEAV
jgi:ubiquinone/menaquinone biosynthesis C-methylase UbiE